MLCGLSLVHMLAEVEAEATVPGCMMHSSSNSSAVDTCQYGYAVQYACMCVYSHESNSAMSGAHDYIEQNIIGACSTECTLVFELNSNNLLCNSSSVC
jgi:hypothetical protein